MKIAIIGGSHAGISCAKRARMEYPEAEITIYEKQAEISFISQSIPLYLMGKTDLSKTPTYTTVAELEAMGIRVKNETLVRRLDTAKKQIFYLEKDSTDLACDPYDKLVFAVGSYPLLPMFHGDFTDKIFVVKDIEDAKAMAGLMGKEEIKKLVVVGGGFIGVEMARIYAQKGLDVTLIQAHEYVLDKYLDEPVARRIEEILRQDGVDIRLSTFLVDANISPMSDGSSQLRVYTDHYEELEADAIIYAIGFRPNSFLLAGWPS